MRRAFLIGCVAVCLPACTSTMDQPKTTAVAPPVGQGMATKTASNPSGLICKKIVTTGTRFSTNDCRTPADWDNIAAQAASETQSQQQPYGRPQ